MLKNRMNIMRGIALSIVLCMVFCLIPTGKANAEEEKTLVIGRCYFNGEGIPEKSTNPDDYVTEVYMELNKETVWYLGRTMDDKDKMPTYVDISFRDENGDYVIDSGITVGAYERDDETGESVTYPGLFTFRFSKLGTYRMCVYAEETPYVLIHVVMPGIGIYDSSTEFTPEHLVSYNVSGEDRCMKYDYDQTNKKYWLHITNGSFMNAASTDDNVIINYTEDERTKEIILTKNELTTFSINVALTNYKDIEESADTSGTVFRNISFRPNARGLAVTWTDNGEFDYDYYSFEKNHFIPVTGEKYLISFGYIFSNNGINQCVPYDGVLTYDYDMVDIEPSLDDEGNVISGVYECTFLKPGICMVEADRGEGLDAFVRFDVTGDPVEPDPLKRDKVVAIESIKSYFEAKKKSDYEDDDYADISVLKESAISNIKNAERKSDIQSIVNSTKSAMDRVPTKAFREAVANLNGMTVYAKLLAKTVYDEIKAFEDKDFITDDDYDSMLNALADMQEAISKQENLSDDSTVEEINAVAKEIEKKADAFSMLSKTVMEKAVSAREKEETAKKYAEELAEKLEEVQKKADADKAAALLEAAKKAAEDAKTAAAKAAEEARKAAEAERKDGTKAGDIVYDKNTKALYKIVTLADKTEGTVVYYKAVDANKKAVVPETVTVNDKKYNVVSIGAKAFNRSNITKVIIKTRNLKKSSVKKSLKGSKVKKIQVKVGNKKLNKTFIKKYKKIFTKKNAGKKVKIS